MGETASRAVIRTGSPADGEAVYRIGTVCFDDAWGKETVERDMTLPHSLYFIAEREGTAVGYACFWFVADEAQLVNIGVALEERRHGTASALLEAGLAEAERRGMASMFLEVRVSNLAAQALYRRFGFAVTALRKGVYSFPVEDGYIMARDIRRKI